MKNNSDINSDINSNINSNINNLTNYIISKATLDDVKQIKFLEDELNISILSEEIVKEDIQNNHYSYFVLKDNAIQNDIAGYIAISAIFDSMDILSLVIKKDYQKKGLASFLLEYVINLAKKNNISSILLEVRKSNIPAINLYEKYNFEKINVRKNYYTNPTEDALIYKLDI